MTDPVIAMGTDDPISRRAMPTAEPSAVTESDLAPDLCTGLALLYLSLPNFVFFLSWVSPLPGLTCGAALAYLLTRIGCRKTPLRRADHAVTGVILLLAIAMVWSYCGGAGHFSYANRDWIVRDAVFGDLIWGQWPVSYGNQDGYPLLLRSAIGYFLPAALVTKALGIQFADIALFAWTATGTFLFLALLPIGQRKPVATLILVTIVILFSGMDALGIVITTGLPPIFPLPFEWWTSFTYSSLTAQLFWAPNHALPIWIATALFCRHWRHGSFPDLAPALFASLPLWSPFALLGQLPFAGLALFFHRRTIANWLWPQWTATALSLVLIGFWARFLSLDIGGIAAGVNEPFRTASADLNPIGDYPVFVLMEFGILALALRPHLTDHRPEFLMAVIVLLALPFFHYGPSNDLLLRCSTPALIVLLWLTLQAFMGWMDAPRRHSFPVLITIILALGAATPISEIWRSQAWKTWPPDYQQTLPEKTKHLPPHYIGRMTDSALRQILRQPTATPPEAERLRQ